MKKFEYLSEREAERLSLSAFVAAARRTLQEIYDRKSHFESNPPVSEQLHLTPADRYLLRGMRIKVEEPDESKRHESGKDMREFE